MIAKGSQSAVADTTDLVTPNPQNTMKQHLLTLFAPLLDQPSEVQRQLRGKPETGTICLHFAKNMVKCPPVGGVIWVYISSYGKKSDCLGN